MEKIIVEIESCVKGVGICLEKECGGLEMVGWEEVRRLERGQCVGWLATTNGGCGILRA